MAQVWNSFDTSSEKKFGDITPDVLNTTSSDCKDLLDSLTSLNSQTQAVRLQLKTKISGLRKNNTRVHQGVRADFGAKSTEYALVKKTRSGKSGRRSTGVIQTATAQPAASA